jgi:putative ATP-binding cassette transporter
LDEATSALDTADESNLYGRLKQLEINYISVGHRRSIIDFHDGVLELLEHDRWQLLSAQEYRISGGDH